MEIFNAVNAVAGTAIAAIVAVIAGLTLRATKAAAKRYVEAKLWKRADPTILDGRIILHNNGPVTATIDRIKITRPRGSKIAWQITNELGDVRSLADADVSNVHVMLNIVEPGRSAGSGMVLRLPRPLSTVREVRFQCRLSAGDQWRRYRWVKVRALTETAIPSMDYIEGKRAATEASAEGLRRS